MYVLRKSKTSSRGTCLLSVLCLGLVGCQSTGSQVANDQVSFSRLAGRWWIPLRDLLEVELQGKPLPEEIESMNDEHLLLATVLPDGSLDWSRTRLGVRHGIHDVRDPGDWCISYKPVRARVRVDASGYTPTTTRIEMHIVDPELGCDGSDFRLSLELSLNPDGTASCVETYIDRGSSSPFSFKLHRDVGGNVAIQNRSQISGRWSVNQPNAKLLLIIRPDGTFDWSSTAAGMLGGWGQLERVGDHSPNQSDYRKSYEVVASQYTPTESRLRLRLYDRVPTPASHETTIELVAKLVDNQRISVLLNTDAGPIGRLTHTATLYRNDHTPLREFYALRVLLELPGSNGSEE